MYIIGVVVGVAGLVAANQVRADGRWPESFPRVSSIGCVGASGIIIN